jgi:thiol-disulfide isomerase/thioredoxin
MSGSEPLKKRGLGWALLALAAVGAAAVLYVIGQASTKPGAGEGLERFAEGSLHRLSVAGEGRAAPATVVRDAAGRPVRIAELPGELVVVNLWATWCAPCVVEMPTLAGLQRAHPEVHVATVSLDRVGELPKAKAFLARHPPLAFYHEPTFALAGALGAQGLPATVIYKDGREVARVTGEADWTSPEARGLIAALLAE